MNQFACKMFFIFGLWCFLVTPTHAQGNGTTLLAKVKKANTNYNDIWGYTAPNGDEYAIVGTTEGTLFYNCANPQNPVEVGFIPGPSSLWRDMKTYGTYAYIVTEGGGGVQIVDMTNPDQPTLVTTWGTQWWANTHNVAIDLGEGLLYACGTNNGMRILDLNSSATDPPLIATYNQNYVHDLHVQDGLAHLAEINNGDYRIVAVNNLPSFPTLDTQRTPGVFTHNTWANEDNTLCVTTDEIFGGRITVYDISNPFNIVQKGRFTTSPLSIVHNAYFVGDIIHCSWYTEGYVAVDASDPNNLKLAGQYDTSSSGFGFSGAWGCYPFSPSGVIYISDMQEGFHIIRLDGVAFEMDHTPLGNTQDENGPYDVTVTIDPQNFGAQTQGAAVVYRVGGGAWQNELLSPTGHPDEWSGSIPGQASPDIVEYYFYAQDNIGNTGWLPSGSSPGDNAYSFAVGKIVQRYFNDFEGATDEGWTHGASVGTDDWERGTPQGKSGDSSRHEGSKWMDPGQAFSGSNVWGTDLGQGQEDGAYESNVTTWLESPPIDLSNANNTTLMFQRWMSVEGQPYDKARILLNNTVVWENPSTFGGDALHVVDISWRQQTYDISNLADGNPNVVVRFELETDEVFEMGGWNIDDFRIVSLEPSDNVDLFDLSGDTSLQVGSTGSYTVSGAAALAPLWILASFNLNGQTINGQPFDIGLPTQTLFVGQTDAAGSASWTSPPVPGILSGRTAYMEARVDSASGTQDSNTLTVQIQ